MAWVPFVVVHTIRFPWTRWGVYSRGELPRSKSAPPVRELVIRRPFRSPPSRNVGSWARNSRASAISLTGMIPVAPDANAVTTVLVNLSTSSTTQVVLLRSAFLRAQKSFGVNVVLI